MPALVFEVSAQHHCKVRRLHLKRMKLLAHASTRMLQGFDKLDCAFIPSRAELIRLLRAVRRVRRGGSDDEESRALEQDGFCGAAGWSERRQML